MDVAFVVVAVVTIVVNLVECVANLAYAKPVVANAASVGVPRSWLPMLGGLKGAGAVGVGLSLFGVPYIGLAAAIGLVLFFVGAVIAHVRARVLHNIYFPGAFLALAVGTLVLGLTTGSFGR